MVLLENSMRHLDTTSVADLATDSDSRDSSTNGGKKMTYNEWRQMRKRRKVLYKAPEFETGLQSLEVQAGYSVKLSVVITAFPAPQVVWSLDDEEIKEGKKFTIDHDESENRYSLLITQIETSEAGCYQCCAQNSEGSKTTYGFINVKDTSKQARKRSVSRRPLISTIREWRSKEEPESDPVKERLMLRNRHCWDWWNLCASSDEDLSEKKREQSCDLELCNSDCRTEEEWDDVRRETQKNCVRSRSLPNMTASIVENKYAKLKSFWEKQKHRT